jgi:hypothetical protein
MHMGMKVVWSAYTFSIFLKINTKACYARVMAKFSFSLAVDIIVSSNYYSVSLFSYSF